MTKRATLWTGLTLAATMALPQLGQAQQARTLELSFTPPLMEPQDICSPYARARNRDDLSFGNGDDRLSDNLRRRYLTRDIQRYQARDPELFFDFIDELITRLASLDDEFAGNEELLARINLFIDAGRFDELRAVGLIEQLRGRQEQLTNNQLLVLAQFYMNGIGVSPDEAYARELIRDAAFGGNANALLSLARMELEGNAIEGWDAPLDLTVTMAFGGLLGQLNAGVCRRAERIAREYLNGDIVSPNPQLAYAWYKFAADMGGAEGAWRIVEFHLDADAIEKDQDVMMHYLRLAVERGISLDDAEVEALKTAGDVEEAELLKILGYNYSADTGRNRPSVSPYFQLAVNLDGMEADEESLYLEYLYELTQLQNAPGFIYTTLGKEVLVRRGRWKGEAEALEHFETAYAKGDPEGTQTLALMLMRYRDDATQVNRSVNLLMETVDRWGMESSLNELDSIYRCKVNDAPRLREADAWAQMYRATQYDTVKVSATDLLALDPFKEPEVLAQIQAQALAGRTTSLAHWVERIQVDPWATDSMHRLWAARLDRSDQGLESFAELEFELATNPAERTLAVELFRRVYLNNGVTTALDLAIALTEDNARDPQIAEEILDLLTRAGNRGEGAAMRLKARLLALGENPVDPVETFREFEEEIENRGDFLALMFAMPYIAREKVDDYVDRAVSLMNCGTKDADELGDIYAMWRDSEMSFHWRTVGLHFEGGHTLSKLRLSNAQMDAFEEGAAPTELDVYQRALAEGDRSAHRRLFQLTADPDLRTYDPAAAADHMLAVVTNPGPGDEAWALATFRKVDDDVQALINGRYDISQLYISAAQRGDVAAKLEFGLLLRETAKTQRDLINSARWLKEAAENGDTEAMTELGYAQAYGIGVSRNVTEALGWLDKAAALGNNRAQDMASILRLGSTQ